MEKWYVRVIYPLIISLLHAPLSLACDLQERIFIIIYEFHIGLVSTFFRFSLMLNEMTSTWQNDLNSIKILPMSWWIKYNLQLNVHKSQIKCNSKYTNALDVIYLRYLFLICQIDQIDFRFASTYFVLHSIYSIWWIPKHPDCSWSFISFFSCTTITHLKRSLI